MSPRVRVLIVDDSALYRKVVRGILEGIPGVEVVGVAANGRIALERILADRPDIITLDLEMPELDGLGLLRELRDRRIHLGALVISSLSIDSAAATTEALQLGAFDFVVKPSIGSLEANAAALQNDLKPRIEVYCQARGIRLGRGDAPRSVNTRREEVSSASSLRAAGERSRKAPAIIGIGISTGGPVTLRKLLPLFPGDFPCPIVIVQHMPPVFTRTLAEDLHRHSSLEVVEGAEGMEVRPGRAILAPGGRQMRLVIDDRRVAVKLTDDPPERNCQPSVDYLFRSLAHLYGDRAWGVILTGMGDDGTRGCSAMKEAGATILAQNEASCVVYGMPRAVAEAGLVDFVEPPEQIAARILEAARQGVPA